jgi:hypothetical protein
MVLLKTGNSDLHLNAIKWYAANNSFIKIIQYHTVMSMIALRDGWMATPYLLNLPIRSQRRKSVLETSKRTVTSLQ